MRVVAPHIDVTAEAHRFNAALGADTELSGIQAHDGAAELLERLPADRWAIARVLPGRSPSRGSEPLRCPFPASS